MKLKKPDARTLTVWHIRLLCAAIVPSFCSAWFAPYINWIWWTFTGAWALAFLYGYIFYYPIKYRKLSYSFNKRCFLIHCGVIYTRVKAIPLTSIQYVSVTSTPLQRLFGICSLFVFCAGSTAYVPGLLRADAAHLRERLCPTERRDTDAK